MIWRRRCCGAADALLVPLAGGPHSRCGHDTGQAAGGGGVAIHPAAPAVPPSASPRASPPAPLQEFGRSSTLADRGAFFDLVFSAVEAAALAGRHVHGSAFWSLYAAASQSVATDQYAVFPSDGALLKRVAAHAAVMRSAGALVQAAAGGVVVAAQAGAACAGARGPPLALARAAGGGEAVRVNDGATTAAGIAT